MNNKKREYERVIVTTKTEYLVPDYVYHDRENGIDDILEDWFKKYNINSHHATRDSCRVGYSTKVIKVEKKGKL